MDGWALVGRIAGVHGVRGEIVVDALTTPERLSALRTLRVAQGLSAPGAARPEPEGRAVLSLRFHKGRALIRLEGVEDRSAAEALVGRGLVVPLSERPPLPEGQYYVDALVGLVAVEDGRRVGRVAAVEEIPGNPLLVLEVDGRGEVLVPLAGAYVSRVDPGAGQLELTASWRDLAGLAGGSGAR